MKIEQRVHMKYHYSYCAYNGLEIEDQDSNKILVEMTNDQWISLAEMLDAKREHINEKRQEELREQVENADTDS
jgi:hypothetical protein